jgi:hypothetical protein
MELRLHVNSFLHKQLNFVSSLAWVITNLSWLQGPRSILDAATASLAILSC